MRDTELIERYLNELDGQLRLPPRTRRRVIGEARDHLEDLTAAAPTRSPTEAQAWAIHAFGDPAALARRFAEELAVGASRRAARIGAATLALFLVLCDLCTSSFLSVPMGWVSDGPGTPLVWITGQVGLVAGVVSLARGRIARRSDGLDTIRLRYVVRGLLVLVACAALTVVVAASGVAVALATGAAHRSALVAVAAGLLLCAAVTAVGGWSARTASHRLASVDGPPLTATGREVLADLLATVGDGVRWIVRRVPVATAPTGFAALVPADAARALRPLDPRDHPWRYASAVALLAGCLVPALDLLVLVAKGELYGSQLSTLAVSAPVLIVFEATLVLLGFATLGRYLGLRPSAR
jgi:hypothetical protein